MKRLVLAAFLLLPTVAHAQIIFGRATAVDGDTLRLGEDRIRLHGIDALEASQTCTRDGEIWQCGQEAKSLLSSLVEGKSVQCQQRNVDAYDRIVATCSAGGLDLARTMIEAGYAVALPQYSNAYVEIEQRMRSLWVGMWSSEFQTPAEYRAANPHLKPPRPKPAARPATVPYGRTQASPQREDAYFPNCAAARAAGAAPIYRGQPGYRPPLDADGDGIACEPYRGR